MLSNFIKRSNLLKPINYLKFQTPLFSSLTVENQNESLPRPDKLYRRLELEVRSADRSVIRSYISFAHMAAKNLEIECGKVKALGKIKDGRNWYYRVERQICLRSAFVHKKHREQYEWRTQIRIMNFFKLTESTLDTFLEYVERNLPEGCSLIVRKYEALPLFDHLVPPIKEEKPVEKKETATTQ